MVSFTPERRPRSRLLPLETSHDSQVKSELTQLCRFAAKLADIVELYVDPPAHAVVLSLDERSQIQALDRTHRHLELIRFLNAVKREVAADKPIRVVLDNYATHKHPKVLAWLARHPR
jgi:hypothetical protein